MRDQKFFICKHCGNIVGMIDNKGVPLACCGEKMTELVANTEEAAVEKHIPVATSTQDGILTVNVGSTLHPMTEEHLINFVYLETENGGQRKTLKAGDSPIATFALIEDKPIAVFAYCNLHGLWKQSL